MPQPDIELLNTHVAKIFRIDDVTAGDPREWIARYRGHLLGEDSAAAYDQLAEAVRPYSITPLFRNDDNRQVIFLIPTPVEPRVRVHPIVNIALFIITFFSVMLLGVDFPPELTLADEAEQFSYILSHIFTGMPFALSLVGILFAHEMGHYITCRYYKVSATLPFFIPLPMVGPFGTLGAFILMRGIPKNKRVLFDVGVAGPIAGLVIAIPVLLYGLSTSQLGPIAHAPAGLSGFLEGNSIFYLLSKYLIFGEWLPKPVDTGGLSLGLYWLKYFFTGHPIPFGGLDVQLNPVALAGWGGLLVTALNLVPVGMLDGGHVAYGLFGETARKFFRVVMIVFVVISILPIVLTGSLASFNSGWLIWMAFLYWAGKAHAQPLDDITNLDPLRRGLGFIMLVVFVLLFTPVIMAVY